MFKIPDLSQPYFMIMWVFIVFMIIVGRYLLIAGLFYIYFYLWRPEEWRDRKVFNRSFKPGQIRREIGWSTLTAMIFAVAGVFTLWCWQNGYTKVYFTVAPYGWWYLPVSFALLIIIHETYYYWIHRLMHHRFIFRYVHKIHHQSNTTSPFAAFSFHPIEGLLQAIIIPAILILLPINGYVLLLQLLIMTFSSVINHLNIEIYPRNFYNHSVGKWIIGATHHSLHHKQYKYNFGLYFTFWDKLESTESPEFTNVVHRTSRKIKPFSAK